MKSKIFFILTILLIGCKTTSRLSDESMIPEMNKDVLILSNLVRDIFLRTNDTDLDIDKLTIYDTLKRITNNFENINLDYRGGYISLTFKFSDKRDTNNVELTETERELESRVRWYTKKSEDPYDGEIQIDYGEKFYRIKKIIINQNSTVANTG